MRPAPDKAEGVIIAQGGHFGGWALYAKDGAARFVYNLLGMAEFVTGATSRFNGKIDLVQIDLGDDNHDHLIDPEELIRIAMARQ